MIRRRFGFVSGRGGVGGHRLFGGLGLAAFGRRHGKRGFRVRVVFCRGFNRRGHVFGGWRLVGHLIGGQCLFGRLALIIDRRRQSHRRVDRHVIGDRRRRRRVRNKRGHGSRHRTGGAS